MVKKARSNIPLSKVPIDDEVRRAAIDALESGRYILGEYTRKFEEEFSRFIGVKFGVGTSSGTSAIMLSLLALGVKPGDKIVVPSHTAFPTVSPILHVGAIPVFVDVDPETYTANPDCIRKAVSEVEGIRGIIAVHLYGHPANLDPILELAEEKGLFLLEDACQAHGAKYKGRPVGSIGHVACFSFYPSKNLTVCGDGGMVVTNDEEVAEKVRMLRDHGRREKYVHEILGYNMRFNEIQAAIGLAQLKKLNGYTERRRKIARLYAKLLDELPLKTPTEAEWAFHVYHLFVVRVRSDLRDRLREWLSQKGVETGIHYPVPCHMQPACNKYTIKTVPHSLTITESLVREIISLPIFPELRDEETEYITNCIAEFFRDL